jgi:hypothetical protein
MAGSFTSTGTTGNLSVSVTIAGGSARAQQVVNQHLQAFARNLSAANLQLV